LPPTMKASQAASSPAGPLRASPEGVDLSLTGQPPPLSRRPSSASVARPLARSVSVAVGSEPRRRAQVSTGAVLWRPAGSWLPGQVEGPPARREVAGGVWALVPLAGEGRPGWLGPSSAVVPAPDLRPGGGPANNLRRSNSATQVSQPPAGPAWPGPLRPAESPDFLMLFEDSPGARKKPAGLDAASADQGATWNVLGEQPGAFASPPRAPSARTPTPAAPRRRECAVTLAPSFTANNRSSKGAVGNRVTAMVRNQHGPAEEAPPPKSSNRAPPSLNNIVKAAAGEALGGGGCPKPPKNLASPTPAACSNLGGTAGLLGRRREVTEEEAERFIHQVNCAAVAIQRWFRRQRARRRVGAAEQQGQWPPPGGTNLLDLHQRKEEARRKAREEKARQARRAAIQVPGD
ncbi:Centrosomal protein of 131 kDa, partial [Galemys pyrenaicus]